MASSAGVCNDLGRQADPVVLAMVLLTCAMRVANDLIRQIIELCFHGRISPGEPLYRHVLGLIVGQTEIAIGAREIFLGLPGRTAMDRVYFLKSCSSSVATRSEDLKISL